MYDIIFLLGAQGSGKTTTARLLKEKLGSPHIDFDWIRGFHLDNKWSDTSEGEEQMSIDNLLYLLKNYIQHDYKNIIVSGFTEQNITRFIEGLKDYKYAVITLVLSDDETLKSRVLTESRDSGFRDFEEAIKFNKKLRDEMKFFNEYKIDNTNQTPEEVISQIENILLK